MTTGGRIRSVRLKDGHTIDSLTNAVSGFGGRGDPRGYNQYLPRSLTQYEIAAAYDGSGMMAKVIDIPALDMVREWRNWQASADQIIAIEAEEKRLDLRGKIRMVETWRGLGGGALILGLPGDPASPAPATVQRRGIAYVHVVMRWQLAIGPEVDDHTDARFGGPEYFELQTSKGASKIHPSRVVCFRGDPVPPILGQTWDEKFWGRSRVQRVLDAVQNVDTAQGAFAGLITKARNTIIGIPGLLDLVSESDGEAALQRRLAAMIMGEGLYNATLRDAGDGTPGAGETIDHRQVTWTGVPEIMMAFATFLSAVSDIPATRLMGKSPDGQNATGESDDRNWVKMVRAKQTLELGPSIDQFDGYLLPSAGIAQDDESVWFEWAPLDVPSEKQEAETFKATMEAVEKAQATAAIPDQAFAKAFQNLMTERGWLPGLEGALAEIPEDERWGLSPDGDGGDDDPSALQAREGGDPGLAGSGGVDDDPARRAANDAASWLADATPRPLYVHRKLLNAAEVIAWAKAQGFTTTLEAADMHVTVLFSRAPVDPMKMGRDWHEDEQGQIVVRPGGPRMIERLGENAVVLRFAHPDIEYRHRDLVEAGGSHDWPEYQPHVTLSYGVPDDMDIEAIEPFNGVLRFGPEIFQALDLDWKSKVTEK